MRPRLPRPHVPLAVQLAVLLRQLGELWPQEFVARAVEQRMLGDAVDRFKAKLAGCLGVEVARLHLDHDPALENRAKVFDGDGRIVGYVPAANDPVYLIYRVGGFRGSDHDIKTRVRGERGQFADNVLAKRERKRLRKASSWRPARRWPKRPFPQRVNPWRRPTP